MFFKCSPELVGLCSSQGQFSGDESKSKCADVRLAEDAAWICSSKTESWGKASPLSFPAKVYLCPLLCVIVYLIIQRRRIDFESRPAPFSLARAWNTEHLRDSPEWIRRSLAAALSKKLAQANCQGAHQQPGWSSVLISDEEFPM